MNHPTRKTIVAAAAQLPAYPLSQADDALRAIEQAISQAADAGADLLVLPECAYPAYLIGSPEQYRRADIMPSDELLVQLARWARKQQLHLVCGFVEDMGTHLFNAAALIDDQGQHLGTYRKSFLWAGDNDWFKAGDQVAAVQTRWGRLGMVICADTRAPEIIARLVMDGAQMIAMPTCWINVAADRGGFENPQPEFLISSRAREFELPFVCANKFGMESPQVGYCGRSLIVDAAGGVRHEAPGDAAALLVDTVHLRPPSASREPPDDWPVLLSWERPLRPAPKQAAGVTLAVWPGTSIGVMEFKGVEVQGAALLMAAALDDERVVMHSDMDVVLPDHIGSMRDLTAGKVACIDVSEFRTFARSRLLALGGAEIICVFNAEDDLKLMRTRAIENRTFILAVGPECGAVVAPSGAVLGYSAVQDDAGIVVTVNMTDAAVKQVAPNTDIWEQRRVRAYR